MLEVFNTLLKHLRLSVEFEANDLQGGSVGSVNLNPSSKDNDEKIVQNAIIQTIGKFHFLWKWLKELLLKVTCLLEYIRQRWMMAQTFKKLDILKQT